MQRIFYLWALLLYTVSEYDLLEKIKEYTLFWVCKNSKVFHLFVRIFLYDFDSKTG